MISADPGRIVALRSSGAARRRAGHQLDALVDAALRDLSAVQAGDMAAIYSAHLDITRAVGVVMHHRLDLEAAI